MNSHQIDHRCSLLGRYEGTTRLRVVLFLWWRSRIFVYRKLVHPNPLRHISLLERSFDTASQVTRLLEPFLSATANHFFDSTTQSMNGFSRRSEWNLPISTQDLKAKLDRKDPITVVETLAPERYREAHIPGALNIPPERIKELAPQLLPNKNAEIVTYCTSLH